MREHGQIFKDLTDKERTSSTVEAALHIYFSGCLDVFAYTWYYIPYVFLALPFNLSLPLRVYLLILHFCFSLASIDVCPAPTPPPPFVAPALACSLRTGVPPTSYI